MNRAQVIGDCSTQWTLTGNSFHTHRCTLLAAHHGPCRCECGSTIGPMMTSPEPASDKYVVLTWGDRWLVVHLPTRNVIAECRDEFAAAGIAVAGNDRGTSPGDSDPTEYGKAT